MSALAPPNEKAELEGQNAAPNSRESLSSDEEFANPTGIKEKALIRKLDMKLLPAVTLLYLLSFLDRSNSALHLFHPPGMVRVSETRMLTITAVQLRMPSWMA
jgi:hypothetical protein